MERFVYFKNIDDIFLELDKNRNEALSYENTVSSLDLYSHNIDPFLALNYVGLENNPLNENPFSNLKCENKCIENRVVNKLRQVVPAKHQQHSKMKFVFHEDIAEAKDAITSPATHDTNGFQFSAKQVFSSYEMKLDIYTELYFSLLYDLNKNQYVHLLLPEWNIGEYKHCKTKREFFLQKLREYRKYERTELFGPDSSLLEKHQTLDIAPNISRLLIISKEFRTMLRDTYNPERKFYQFLPAVIQKFATEWSITLRPDDDILLERLLGFETSLALYELFSTILTDNSQDEIKKHFDIMERIIERIMEWPGEHSRSFIIGALTNYIKKISTNTICGKADKIFLFIEENLNQFISMHIDKYYLLLENTLYYEYIQFSKDKEILEYELEEMVIHTRELYSSNPKLYRMLNNSPETVKYEYIYQFIQGCVIKYACKKRN